MVIWLQNQMTFLESSCECLAKLCSISILVSENNSLEWLLGGHWYMDYGYDWGHSKWYATCSSCIIGWFEWKLECGEMGLISKSYILFTR